MSRPRWLSSAWAWRARPDWVHFLCGKFTDFYLEDYTRAADATCGRIDLYLLIRDSDTQRGSLICPAFFRGHAGARFTWIA